MEIVIREYRPDDRVGLIDCMNGLQGFIAAIDPLERNRGTGEFDAAAYTDVILDSVKKRDGIIYIAERNNAVVGCIAGWLVPEEDQDLIASNPSRTGRIAELYVAESVRGQKLGSKLTALMELWLKEKGCDSVRVEVFSPNEGAADFYRKCGYTDRCIDMLKML